MFCGLEHFAVHQTCVHVSTHVGIDFVIRTKSTNLRKITLRKYLALYGTTGITCKCYCYSSWWLTLDFYIHTTGTKSVADSAVVVAYNTIRISAWCKNVLVRWWSSVSHHLWMLVGSSICCEVSSILCPHNSCSRWSSGRTGESELPGGHILLQWRYNRSSWRKEVAKWHMFLGVAIITILAQCLQLNP